MKDANSLSNGKKVTIQSTVDKYFVEHSISYARAAGNLLQLRIKN